MKVKSTLPDGRPWKASIDAHILVWSLWRRLCRLVLPLGQGVSIEVKQKNVVLTSVYAPLWRAHILYVSSDARFCDASEQEAPELPEETPADRICRWLDSFKSDA